MVACRFMHIFIVDCRFALLVVDVDFGQKSIVDCRQKGPKTCDPLKELLVQQELLEVTR